MLCSFSGKIPKKGYWRKSNEAFLLLYFNFCNRRGRLLPYRNFMAWIHSHKHGVYRRIVLSSDKYNRQAFRPSFRFSQGCSVITVIEFISGFFLNIVYGLDVWDYHTLPFNLLGQICPLYSFLWFILSFISLMFIDKKFKIR